VDGPCDARYGSRVGRVVVFVLSLALEHFASSLPAASAACAPPFMLWAWERPEDLSSIDPVTTGVAYLARTIRLRDGGFAVRSRLQPLAVPPGAHLVAVVRIEHAARRSGGADALPDPKAVAAVIAAMARPGVAAVQVDFDAARSERGFYRALLVEVRAALPPSTGLQMTALASWALGDRWIDGLPVDEVVPMLFRMGADDRVVRRHFADGGDFGSPLARASLGIAIDEPRPAVPAGRRVYLFNPRPWSPARAAAALAEVREWRGSDAARCSPAS
jgi:hypothetical protein